MSKEEMSKIVKEIREMSVMKLAELVKELEEEFGVSAAAPAAAVAAPAAAVAVEEKTEFKVTLKDVGSQKIKVIKALRSVTTLSLGDAKNAVEGAPYVVADSASKEDAEKMKKTLEEVGAKVELS
jgi:large subunit ribosomal protein L7/L12